MCNAILLDDVRLKDLETFSVARTNLARVVPQATVTLAAQTAALLGFPPEPLIFHSTASQARRLPSVVPVSPGHRMAYTGTARVCRQRAFHSSEAVHTRPQTSKKAAQLSAAEAAIAAISGCAAMQENVNADVAAATRSPAQSAAAAVKEGCDRNDPTLVPLFRHWASVTAAPLPAPFLLLSEPGQKGAARLCRREGYGEPAIRSPSGACAVAQCSAGALVRALITDGAAFGAFRLSAVPDTPHAFIADARHAASSAQLIEKLAD